MVYLAAFLFPFLLTNLYYSLKKCEKNEDKTPVIACILLGIDMIMLVRNNPFPF